MSLTTDQKVTLRAYIDGDPTLSSYPNNTDGNLIVTGLLNAASNPAFIVWKTSVPIREVGETFNASELAGLTSLNTQRLQNLAAWLVDGVTPSKATVRAFFDDVFSGAGGASTRAALLALWKRTATRAEQVFATGTGSDGSPGSLTFEGTLSVRDVEDARNL